VHFCFSTKNGGSGTHSERGHFVRRDNRRRIELAIRILRLIFRAAVQLVTQSLKVEAAAA
jgi:hypothetical protein